MPGRFSPCRLRVCFALVAAACLIAVAFPHVTVAAGSKQLQRVKGTVGYATVADAGDFKPVFGKMDLPDPDFAVTRAASAAVLAMPDSSLISLGENTNVQVGAFDSASASPGAQITINGGSMRFDIRRPQGGAANYRFVTPTSQTAVRGTVGLISFVNGITTVGCVACAADSVVVTTATQTITLVTGQFVAISITGAITTGALGGVLGGFTGAGVPVSAETGAAAAGLPAAAGSIIPAAAVGAAAAAAVGISATQGSPAPQQTNSPPTAQPVATPTGTVNLTGNNRAPLGIPTSAAAHTPIPVPQATQTPRPGFAPGAPRIGR